MGDTTYSEGVVRLFPWLLRGVAALAYGSGTIGIPTCPKNDWLACWCRRRQPWHYADAWCRCVVSASRVCAAGGARPYARCASRRHRHRLRLGTPIDRATPRRSRTVFCRVQGGCQRIRRGLNSCFGITPADTRSRQLRPCPPILPTGIAGSFISKTMARTRRSHTAIFCLPPPGESHGSTILSRMSLQSLLHNGLRGMG